MYMTRVERALGNKTGSGEARGVRGLEEVDGWELQQGSSMVQLS